MVHAGVCILLLYKYTLCTLAAISSVSPRVELTDGDLTSIAGEALAISSSPLEVLELYPPVLVATHKNGLGHVGRLADAPRAAHANDLSSCQDLLVAHSFAYSYGKPYVGTYEPPSCSFNRVIWNLTVQSQGRQFDRLAIVYFGNVELLRTSTAEPTVGGIRWTYLKDMTNYLSLFKKTQKIIFDLGNLVDDTYTAAFNVTLTSVYFTAVESAAPADLVLAVSSGRSAFDSPSVWTVPPENASKLLILPSNTARAVFTIAATGQSAEEFWWSNVLELETGTFPQYGALNGYSPFREVQLLIDGRLAGVVWPFPIIFTGGVVPGLWRPVVGIDAFDLKEDEIDITPWLPLLCDDKPHNFTIRIAGLVDTSDGSAQLSETTDNYWLVSGKIFIWLDIANHTTTGTVPLEEVSAPSLEISSSVVEAINGTNETLYYQVSAHRQLSITSTVRTSRGARKASWQQHLSYTNLGNYTKGGNVQVNQQLTQGHDTSSSGYSRRYNYPLYAWSAYSTDADNFTIQAVVQRGKNIEIKGQPVFPPGLETFSGHVYNGAALSTTQNGSATYMANTTASTSYSYGSTEQDMVFSGVESDTTDTGRVELWHRHVLAVNGTVVEDEEDAIHTRAWHGESRQYNGHGNVVPPGQAVLGHE